MFKTSIKAKLTTFFLLLLVFLTTSSAVFARYPTEVDEGSGSGSTGGALGKIDLSKLGVPSDVNAIIGGLVQLVYAVAGIAFFFMFILGGLRYLTAGGDEKAAASARATLTQAMIGLVIVVSAFLITQLLFTIFGIKGFIQLG